MKIAAWIARILLGLLFVFSGLNGFFQFYTPDKASMPTGLAGEFFEAMMKSHYMWVIFAVQAIGGALLLIGRYVPLGITLLGAMIVNILCYHIFLFHHGWQMAAVVTILWWILFIHYRKSFSGILAAKA